MEVREHLGGEGVVKEWKRGEVLSPDRAISFALSRGRLDGAREHERPRTE
jgi:hypothetical protein